MVKRYYLDASIYIDYYEDRKDRFRPLGEWAHRLLYNIEQEKSLLFISDLLMEELEKYFSQERADLLLNTYASVIKKIKFNNKQLKEARKLARKRKVPLEDALHAIIARDNKAILVTRDKHFEKLLDITIPRKPEDLI